MDSAGHNGFRKSLAWRWKWLHIDITSCLLLVFNRQWMQHHEGQAHARLCGLAILIHQTPSVELKYIITKRNWLHCRNQTGLYLFIYFTKLNNRTNVHQKCPIPSFRICKPVSTELTTLFFTFTTVISDLPSQFSSWLCKSSDRIRPFLYWHHLLEGIISGLQITLCIFKKKFKFKKTCKAGAPWKI